ncbi:hypothetical protein LZS94_13915 [Aliivibrio fischeri]|uniref:hypothetical protein n=1 Tax=Aliivibrio fischeri TaxID=668 RepID=UPI001F31AB2C|nr:hypothetical protein [Aliivibrio fischeri]MCE7578601.1 hypothetical protein [Aliivibrio fischeri]MCE7590090.1 hypothetical protein [Aliivibrio fischeri]
MKYKYWVGMTITILSSSWNMANAIVPKLPRVSIDQLHLSSPPKENEITNINYKTTPDSDIKVLYSACILNDDSSECEITDDTLKSIINNNKEECELDGLLTCGNISGDGFPEIPINVPKDTNNKYLRYCIKVTYLPGSYAPSENECRSELITNGDIDNKNALFSYLNQTKNFSLYNAPITDAKDDVSFVTSNSAALSLSSEGDASLIGYGSEVTNAPNLPKAKEVYSMFDGFAIKSESDDAIIWGQFDTTPSYINQVEEIFPAPYAMAAILKDGGINTAGDMVRGGSISSEAQKRIDKLLSKDGLPKAIYHTAQAFLAVFDMPSGKQKLVAWGQSIYGGTLPDEMKSALSIKDIVTSQDSFTVLDNDGNAYSWGHSPFEQHQNIQTVYATRYAFAGITTSGKVKAWGDSYYGGLLSSAATDFTNANPITRLCASDASFVAISDGNKGVAAWGNDYGAGYIPSNIQTELDATTITDDFHCASTEKAIALYDSSHLFVWGDKKYGGTLPSNIPTFSIANVIGNNHAFLMKAMDDVYAWGGLNQGGCIPDGHQCLSSDDSSLNLRSAINDLSDISQIGSFNTFSEFEEETAGGFYVRSSNAVVMWGNSVPDGVFNE